MRAESPKAHAALRTYLEMGEQRSVQAVATRLSKSRTLISRWAQRFHWKERSKFFDDFVNDQEVRSFLGERRAMARRHANVAVLGVNIAAQGLMQVQQALQQADQHRPLKLTEITRLLEVSARLERINRGEPDEDQVASISVTISQQSEPRYTTAAREAADKPTFDA